MCPVPLKRAVITAVPSIKVHQIGQQDLFVIFASDGLWEQLTDKAAVEIVFKNPRAVSQAHLTSSRGTPIRCSIYAEYDVLLCGICMCSGNSEATGESGDL